MAGKKLRQLTEARIAEHDRRIRGVLARAYDEHGLVAVTDYTPADAVMDREVDVELDEVAAEAEYGWPGGSRPRLVLRELKEAEAAEVARIARRDLVWWLAGDGVHPFKVCQRFYALAYASFPEVVGSMDGSWLAEILGQGRAAFSALMGRLFGSVAAERLGVEVKVGGQKAAAAAAGYAANARVNKPRRQLNGDAGWSAGERGARRAVDVARERLKLEAARREAERRDLERDAAEFERIVGRVKSGKINVRKKR